MTRIGDGTRRAALALGLAAALGLALLLSAATAPRAGAIVPPKNCHMMTVKGKRYQIKADQMRCSRARDYSRAYLSRHRRPAGYRCSDYGSETRLKFRCSRGIKVFFAIKR